jgi:hypothetical protein
MKCRLTARKLSKNEGGGAERALGHWTRWKILKEGLETLKLCGFRQVSQFVKRLRSDCKRKIKDAINALQLQ